MSIKMLPSLLNKTIQTVSFFIFSIWPAEGMKWCLRGSFMAGNLGTLSETDVGSLWRLTKMIRGEEKQGSSWYHRWGWKRALKTQDIMEISQQQHLELCPGLPYFYTVFTLAVYSTWIYWNERTTTPQTLLENSKNHFNFSKRVLQKEIRMIMTSGVLCKCL